MTEIRDQRVHIDYNLELKFTLKEWPTNPILMTLEI